MKERKRKIKIVTSIIKAITVKKIKAIFYKQTNFALFVFVTLSQHIQTPVTLVSHSHNISQLVLLGHCNQYQQPTDDDPYYI